MDDLFGLIRPTWEPEHQILAGLKCLSSEEKKEITARLKKYFKNGLPFQVKHDKLLYIYSFSLLAQLKSFSIQLSMQLESSLDSEVFKKKSHAQLVDELFHATVLTKVVFLLSTPFGTPPECGSNMRSVADFISSIKCPNVLLNVNNIYNDLLKDLFAHLKEQHIAPDLFQSILKNEHIDTVECGLNNEQHSSDQDVLKETFQIFEELIIKWVGSEPQYGVAIGALFKSQRDFSLLERLHQNHEKRLKKINLVPSEKWEVAFKFLPDIFTAVTPYHHELHHEFEQEFHPIDMDANQKMSMAQMKAPGDPKISAQFDIDMTHCDFLDKKYTHQIITSLMIQAISQVLNDNPSLRNFISYKKLHQSRSSYVALLEPVPDCDNHMGVICLKDSHQVNHQDLWGKINRSLQLMKYCYKKRESIDAEHPNLKSRLEELLYDYAHDVYSYPTPGAHSVFLSNIGAYGYTHASVPLIKHSGLHILLLSLEKKPVWNENTQSFEPRVMLPVSISADKRVFDGIWPISSLLNTAFQKAVEAFNKQANQAPIKGRETDVLQEKINKIADDLIDSSDIFERKKFLAQLYYSHKSNVSNEIKKILGDDTTLYDRDGLDPSNFKYIADKLLLDYLGFNADETTKDENFIKIIDKLLSQDLEIGYRILASLQHIWFDYVDVEDVFNDLYQKIAHSRLGKLAKNFSKMQKMGIF